MFKIYFKEKDSDQIQIKSVNNFEEACELSKHYSLTAKYGRVFVTTPEETVLIFENGEFLK